MATRVKQKAAARKANADKRPRAVAKYVRVSPRKVQIVIDLIRGKQVDDALAILMYTPSPPPRWSRSSSIPPSPTRRTTWK